MPSPFPGMNPYLEQESVWQDFHDTFLPAIRSVLAPQVSPNYIVKVEEYLFIHEPTDERRLLLGHGDVNVVDHNGGTGSTALLAAPQRVLLPAIDFEKHLYLEIRDRDGRELITVLEILSPT